MNFESITIKNFRNFENIKIDLSNKNVFFGMNDVGKTNFLYALRFIFDKNTRKQNLLDTDFYRKKIETPIEIIVTININDTEDSDSQKLRAQLKGRLLSSNDKVYIKLLAEYDELESIAIPILFWGGDLENLQEMKNKGFFYEIDQVVNVIYIDSYVDLYSLFKKNTKNLILSDNDSEDKTIFENIENNIHDLNSNISSLSGIKNFEDKISAEYKKFKNDNITISVKSEISINGIYSNIIPYIKKNEDELLYPTSGEGRKKLLAYSIFDLLSKDVEERKINLFLVEEPENHLHRSMQLMLSRILFVDESYNYLFLTTHSSLVLSEMDNVNLIRIYNETKVDSLSVLYRVPDNFKTQRKKLNQGLSEAVFSDKVLLVEGPSEEILFDKILSTINPFYEAEGIYILPVNGFGFREYFEILNKLKIKNIIKTDNDLRKIPKKELYSVLGLYRINDYTEEDFEKLPTDPVKENTVHMKRLLYDNNRELLDLIRKKYKIFLSRCSLEEDLDEVIHDEMIEYLSEAEEGNVIKYLQEAKKYNMVKLVEKLTPEDCRKIYEHYNFACLKELML